MRICRVFPTFQVDFKYTEHYLAKEMQKLGHSTTFVTSDKYLTSWKPYLKTKDEKGYRAFEYFDVYRLPAFFPSEKAIFKNWFALYGKLFKQQYDVLHLLGLGTFTTCIVLFLSFFSSAATRPKIVISDHTDPRTHAREGTLANMYYFFFKVLYKLMGSKVSAIISFSDVGVQVLAKRFSIPKSAFSIIPLGYDSDTYFFDATAKNKDDLFVIGFAGKIDEKKRVDVLLKAVAKTSCKEHIKLIIVGAKEGNPYIDLLKNTGKQLRLNIEWRPFASTADLATFYNYIDLAVYPGGISITTIEANGCGTPVVIYRSIDNLENRVENGRGFLFSNFEELVYLIEQYYTWYMQGQINNLQIEKATRESSSWEVISEQYLHIYNSK